MLREQELAWDNTPTFDLVKVINESNFDTMSQDNI